MARAGLTADVVTKAAAELLNREGRQVLTLARVAEELGVRSPSLYNHIEGLEGLEREIALGGIDQLADACRSAVMGRSASDALWAMSRTYRDFARSQPGVYALTQVARPGDAEYEAQSERVLEPVVAVLAGFGHQGDDLIHAARALRAALHGFALLEVQGGFGLDIDVEASFEWMIGMLDRGVKS